MVLKAKIYFTLFSLSVCSIRTSRDPDKTAYQHFPVSPWRNTENTNVNIKTG